MNWSQFFVRLIIWLHKNRGAQLFVYACILSCVCTRVFRERATHSELFKIKLANISNSKQQTATATATKKIVRAIFNSSWCISWFVFIPWYVYCEFECWLPKNEYNELLTNRFFSVVNLIVVYCEKKERRKQEKNITKYMYVHV